MTKSVRQIYTLALIIVWLAFGLRVYQLDFQSIWWDEGHSIFVASHPIPAIPTLPAMDVHPPAYFTLLHIWMTVAGKSEFALRYLSVVFSLLTIALLWRFAKLLSPQSTYPAVTVLTALLAALSPLYVTYAQEVRSYAMITCLGLASTFVLWRLLLPGHQKDTGQKRARLLCLYVVLTAACLYTHYFTIFLLIFQNLFWLIWLLRGKFVRKYETKTMIVHAGLWLASQIGIMLLFAPQLFLATRQITSYTNPNLTPPSLTEFILHSWQAYTVGLTVETYIARWGMALMAGILIISWLIQFFTNRLKPTLQFALLLLWFVIPLVFYFVILQRQPSFEPRYLMLITPSLFLLWGYGLGNFNSRLKNPNSTFYVLRPTNYTLTLIAFITFSLALHSYYTNQAFFKDDSAGVANWLTTEAKDNDIIYVDVPHPFHYYAEQKAIAPPLHYLFVDIHTAADRLNHEAAGRDRLFWITWRGSDTDPRGIIPFLLEKAGTLGGQRDFRGYQVRWFDLPRGTKFSLPKTLTPVQAVFGDVLQLDGLAYSKTVTDDEPIWITFHFARLRETNVDYKVSLRLRDAEGNIVGQTDQDLLNDRHVRTSDWILDDPALNQATNVYLLSHPPGLPAGSYRLEAVVYSAEPPYPSEGVTGLETIDDVSALIGHVKINP